MRQRIALNAEVSNRTNETRLLLIPSLYYLCLERSGRQGSAITYDQN